MEPLHWKLVVDATDPHAQAAFWAAALRYVEEDHRELVGKLLAAGAVPAGATVTVHAGDPEERLGWHDLAAVRHPDDPVSEENGAGLGRRILFQRVPEAKTVKNRVHLDVHAPAGGRDAEVERLEKLGASVLRRVAEPGGAWVVMADPEGNEFCVH
ncbi:MULTISPECIES: VOC family protein [unclassified Streptomyces]|uniref:VOC family protein n=1 Tax=unclassified Streptomyces TaxID=2593676 RepID=UPI00331795F1